MPRISKTQFILQQIGPFVVDGRWQHQYRKAVAEKQPLFEINNERSDGQESTLIPTSLVLLCSEVVMDVSDAEFKKYRRKREEAREKVMEAMVNSSSVPNEDGVFQPEVVR